jgi:hypothetical protein
MVIEWYDKKRGVVISRLYWRRDVFSTHETCAELYFKQHGYLPRTFDEIMSDHYG